MNTLTKTRTKTRIKTSTAPNVIPNVILTAALTGPPADLRATWAAWAAWEGHTGERAAAYQSAAEARWWGRTAARLLLRGPVAALLAQGMTEADVRLCSRKGRDPLGASALPRAAFHAFCSCLEDLSYEYPAGPERRTVHLLVWCADRIRVRTKAKTRAETRAETRPAYARAV